MLAMESFSVDMTSYALAAQVDWPLVTIPDFPIRGLAARQQMNVDAIGLIPLVSKSDRQSWETYATENQGWIQYARMWEKDRSSAPPSANRLLRAGTDLKSDPASRDLSGAKISEYIFKVTKSGQQVADDGNGPFAPIWMTSPAPSSVLNINFNLLSHQHLWEEIEIAIDSRQAVISKILNMESRHDSITSATSTSLQPVSALYYPIFDSYASGRAIVGLLAAEVQWIRLFEKNLPESATGLICVVENACSQSFTYRVDGSKATYLGASDLHDPSYDKMVEARSISFLADLHEDFAGVKLNFEPCPFSLRVYPSQEMERSYRTNQARGVASAILLLFFVSAGILFVYDNVMSKNSGDDRSVVVLERLFPGVGPKPTIVDRVKSTIDKVRPGSEWTNLTTPSHFKATIQSIPGFRLGDKAETGGMCEATVLLADIYGLEGWNAGREPQEKCDLLDTVHRTFRIVGKRHGISQIETSGDSFVVIKGSNGDDDNHAAALAHFACDCRKSVGEKLKALQARGLAIRFGMHSGHVQAGGTGSECSTYQLVGDTIDTTYQMLSSSRAGKIHVSVDTAELLNLAGKGDWLVPREDLILVKGKGEMSTFWIRHKTCLASSEPPDLLSGSDFSSQSSMASFDDVANWEIKNMTPSQTQENKFQAVIDRTVQVLLPYLKKIQAKRNAEKTLNISHFGGSNETSMENAIIDEAREVVRMPPFDGRVVRLLTHGEMLDLPEEIEKQLQLYITSIVSTYRSNEFHNVEHAVHVCLTMDKMIKQLLTPERQDVYVDFGGKPRSAESIAFDLENRSCGLASDPLAQFSLVFASLVHDVDHLGVSNQQLIKEGSPIASLYRNQSVAEQNSVDISWWLMMTPNFAQLRTAIYANGSEMQRFRQIMVNTIIATDIMDRDMKIHRDRCWKQAFEGGGRDASSNHLRDMKATMIAEHLMQAADHSHTMQSYQTFLKWNQRSFDEMYAAYHAGRADKDPTTWWYVGELAFFDKFIIPLAVRLKDSGVLGTAGDDYLKNALQNRSLWAADGKKIIHDMKERFNRKIVSAQDDTIEFYTNSR